MILQTSRFGIRLKQARQAAGLSQEELAQALSLKSRQSVSQMERGVQLVDISQIERMANLLQVSPCWLAFGEGEKS